MGNANISKNDNHNTNSNSSNNGGGGCNTKKFNNNKKGGGKGSKKFFGANKRKGFNRKITDGVLKNIFILSDKGIPISGQCKKFSKSEQIYTDNKGLSHVATCIK